MALIAAVPVAAALQVAVPEAAVVEVAAAAEAVPITAPSGPPVVNDGRPPPPPVPMEQQTTPQVPDEVDEAPSTPLPAEVPVAPVQLLDDDMPPPPPMPLEESPSRLLADFDFGLPPPPPPLNDDMLQPLGDSEDDEEREAPGMLAASVADDVEVAVPAQLVDAAAAAEEEADCPELNDKVSSQAKVEEHVTVCPQVEVADDAKLQAQDLVDTAPRRSSDVQLFDGEENSGAAIARTSPSKNAARVDKARAVLQENNDITTV